VISASRVARASRASVVCAVAPSDFLIALADRVEEAHRARLGLLASLSRRLGHVERDAHADVSAPGVPRCGPRRLVQVALEIRERDRAHGHEKGRPDLSHQEVRLRSRRGDADGRLSLYGMLKP